MSSCNSCWCFHDFIFRSQRTISFTYSMCCTLVYCCDESCSLAYALHICYVCLHLNMASWKDMPPQKYTSVRHTLHIHETVLWILKIKSGKCNGVSYESIWNCGHFFNNFNVHIMAKHDGTWYMKVMFDICIQHETIGGFKICYISVLKLLVTAAHETEVKTCIKIRHNPTGCYYIMAH
jgi:hypothetical protein